MGPEMDDAATGCPRPSVVLARTRDREEVDLDPVPRASLGKRQLLELRPAGDEAADQVGHP